MRRLAAVAIALALIGCASHRGSGASSLPGHGALSVRIVPNPIVAHSLGGDVYELPFDVVLRETGGRPVTINRVTADVYAFGGGMRVASESYDVTRLRERGYDTTVPANGEVRYHFAPRKSVPDERLFNGVTGEVRVEGTDDTGTPATARVSVTVTK